jgi:thiamine kinase-like enzyme
MIETSLQEALQAFDFPGTLVEVASYGSGHINDTRRATFRQADGSDRHYILQRINTQIFTDPDGLMDNIVNVTKYLKQKITAAGGDPDRETLTVLHTKEGHPMARTMGGKDYWRCYPFIENTVSYDLVENENDFYTVARAFGHFQMQLSDYPASTLHETIPHFHDTPNRYANFHKALAADALGRAKDAKPEIDFVLAHEKDAGALTSLLAAGKLPLRVTHNDTKLNNILLDKDTGKALCVIDLDTVMPGLVHYDFGDSIRFGASTALEDEQDLSKVHFSLELFEVFTKGFLESAGSVLTPLEKETLPIGAKLMTLECGVRFLTDYLEGDTYFKIHRPGHNLDRCRTQFKLVQEMEEKAGQMQEVIQKYA